MREETKMARMDEIIKSITDRFGPKITAVYKRSEKRSYLTIAPEDVVDVVRFVFKDLGMRFNIASGVDEFQGIEMLYHFTMDKAGLVVTIRTMIRDKVHPSIATITPVTRSAWWIEREIHEMFGVDFVGNNDLRPLLLPDDWPKGTYPLRKDFVPAKRDSRKA